MIDIQILRQDPETFRQLLRDGRGDPERANIDEWLQLDQERAGLVAERDSLREERNRASKMGRPSPEEIARLQELRRRIQEIEGRVEEVEKRWQEILDFIPNLPLSHDAMPRGRSEDDNVIERYWWGEAIGERPGSGRCGDEERTLLPCRSAHWDESLNEAEHHVEVGERLGLLDISQGAKVSGTRFKYLVHDGALLEWALQQLMITKLRSEGFLMFSPPLLLKERALYGTSHFPEGRDQVYELQETNLEDRESALFLAGSSEPSNFAYFMDRVVDESVLPYKVFATTPCFRSEVGSWGRDVRGIKRVHQFSKVEMNCVCTPEQSGDVFSHLLSINEWLWRALDIPYRVVRKCTADAGYLASAEQIDIEVWLPGQKEWMEVGTDTNTTDYQARRLNIKYSDSSGRKRFAHTVNDTGIALERAIVAILDHYQQSNGTVLVPKVLQQYLGKEVVGR